jgi:hypothetical protein
MDVMQLSRTDFFSGCGCGCDAIDATQSTHVNFVVGEQLCNSWIYSFFSFLPEYPTPFLLVLLLFFCFLFVGTYHLSWAPAAQQQEGMGFLKFLWV